jgi:hypothetical protein
MNSASAMRYALEGQGSGQHSRNSQVPVSIQVVHRVWCAYGSTRSADLNPPLFGPPTCDISRSEPTRRSRCGYAGSHRVPPMLAWYTYHDRRSSTGAPCVTINSRPKYLSSVIETWACPS